MPGTQYAQIADFYLFGLQAAAVAQYSAPQLNSLLLAESGDADAYLRSRFVLPLTAWPVTLTKIVCVRGAFTILSARGANPRDPANQWIAKRAEDALQLLRDIASNKAMLEGIVDSSTSQSEDGTPGDFTLQQRFVRDAQDTVATGFSNVPPAVGEDDSGQIVLVGPPKSRGW